MDISIQTLHRYVEKIAKKVLNDESSKPVISGTIKSSLPGIYEVQLVNGNETSLVRAESLYADKTFAVDDYVYLVRAESNRGDEYETKYFIVGLVTTVEQNFANLTEWERFLGDGQKITSEFNNEVIIISQKTNIEDDSNTTENEANNFTNFINAVRTNGVFLFSTKVSTEIKKETTFGFEFIFTFDDNSTKTEFFSGLSFVGQPWSLKEVAQKKIFDLGTQNTLKSIKITKVGPTNETFNVTDVSLESGTFLDLAQDFKVTLENVKGKNYFNKIDNKYVAQIKANVNYGNQKLDTKALKYYWFVKLYDDYYLSIAEKSTSFQDVLKKYKIDLSETDDNIIKDGQINRQVLEENLKDNDNKENIINEISMTWFEVRTTQTNENSLGGVGWNCLNDFSYAKIIDKNGITERKDVLIYKTDDNILEIDYNKAQEWLINYENEIKCVVGYQLVNATSEPIKIYNFNHESYEVTIKFSDDTELPLLYLEETAKINAVLNQKLVGLTVNDIEYRWYLNDDTKALSYIEETKDNNGNVKEETVYYSGSSLEIGYPTKSSKDIYRLDGEYGNFTCRVFKKDGSNEVIADAPPALRVWSAIAADKQLKEEKHYVYWLDIANNLRFSPFEVNAKIQNEIDAKYIAYKANGEILGTVVSGIDEDAFKWLNGSEPFTKDGVYYLYYSEQVQVKSALESDPNVVYRYNNFSKPQILRYVERKTENDGKIKIIDLLNDGKVEQLNTFNKLSDNGLSDGIYYEDAGYGKTMDTAPDSNKLTTGKGYYKKVDTYGYQKVDIDKFEENKDYYIKNANNEYEKYIGDFDKEKEYYIHKLVKTEYILREKNSENYEMSGKEPQNFLVNEEYYEQIEGGDLYINASFIRSGHLEVADGENTVFSADLENNDITINTIPLTLKRDKGEYHLAINTTPIKLQKSNGNYDLTIDTTPINLQKDDNGIYKLKISTNNFHLNDNVSGLNNLILTGNITATGGSIGGFHIVENHLANGSIIEPKVEEHTVLLSGKGVGGSGSDPFGAGDFVFWAGEEETGDLKTFWIKKDGTMKTKAGYIGLLSITETGINYQNNFSLSPNGLIFEKSDSKIAIGDIELKYVNGSTYLQANGPLVMNGSNGTKINLMKANNTDVKYFSLSAYGRTTVHSGPEYTYSVVVKVSDTPLYDIKQKYISKVRTVYKPLFENAKYTYYDIDVEINSTTTENVIILEGNISQNRSIEIYDMYTDTWKKADANSPVILQNNIAQSSSLQNIEITGDLYPEKNNTYSLGEDKNHRWKGIFLSSSPNVNSDRNLKKNILSLSDQSSQFFDKLNPVSYKFIENDSDRTHIGFIAQDVEQALYDVGLTTKDFAGICYWDKEDGTKGYSLRYEEFISLNTFEIQKLKKRISDLELELKEIKGEKNDSNTSN